MIKYFETPITKRAEDMTPGDIFRTEYGDYGNFCNFVFESHKMRDQSTLETTYHQIGKTESERCYEFTKLERATYNVIGTETPD